MFDEAFYTRVIIEFNRQMDILEQQYSGKAALTPTTRKVNEKTMYVEQAKDFRHCARLLELITSEMKAGAPRYSGTLIR